MKGTGRRKAETKYLDRKLEIVYKQKKWQVPHLSLYNDFSVSWTHGMHMHQKESFCLTLLKKKSTEKIATWIPI